MYKKFIDIVSLNLKHQAKREALVKNYYIKDGENYYIKVEV